MSHPSQLDQTSAIFEGLTSIWGRVFVFLGLGLIAHFVGGNIHQAPDFVAAVQSRGLAGLRDMREFDIGWVPLQWAGTIFMSFTHPLTFIYPFFFAAAAVAAFRSDDVPRWVTALLIVVQPLDTFLIAQKAEPLAGEDFIIAATAMGTYLALAAAGIWAWIHFEDLEE